MRYAELMLALFLGAHAWAQSVDTNVDDSNVFDSAANLGGVQYFPDLSVWPDGNATNIAGRYNQSLHWSSNPGARIAYFFQGDAVYWYGDKAPDGGVANVNLDGQNVGTVNFSATSLASQQLLWSQTGLGKGDHQLVISRSQDGSFCLDYFRIVSSNNTIAPSGAGPGSSAIPAGARIADDSDPMVSYDGGWEFIRNDANNGPEAAFYMNTVHRTTVPGATLTFTFTGSGVWYFSDIDTTHGYVQISLDGGAAETVGGYNDRHLAQRLIWGKSNLAYREHKITVAHVGTPNQWSTLDYFMYLPREGNVSSNPTSGSSDTPPANGAAYLHGGMIGLGLHALLFIGGTLVLY